MKAALVLAIYLELERRNAPVWIDGGWCVDALLGHQTRPHDDLDIVVEARHVLQLKRILEDRGFEAVARTDTTPWNFVLGDGEGNKVDVHVIMFDAQGRGVLGPPELNQFYPTGALDGIGAINGHPVRCVGPVHMVAFKTSFAQREIDRADVAALCDRFQIPSREGSK